MVTFQGQEAEGKIRRRQFTVWNYEPMMAGSKEARNCELLAIACPCARLHVVRFFLCAGAETAMGPIIRPVEGGSSNVDQVLTRTANDESRALCSDFKCLISCVILVAGTGFEPVTFRL